VLLALALPRVAGAQTTCTETSPAVSGHGADLAGLVADCTALLGAKNTLQGTASLNWAVDLDISSWDGITVGGTPPRVTLLDLPGYNFPSGGEMTGSIPAALGTLTELTKLVLSFNALTGSIPAALGNLANLTDLILNSNQLSGSIPATWGNATHPLPNLQKLQLGENQLRGSLPAALGRLPKLTHLELYTNALSGSIPATWGTTTHPFAELDTLSLYENRLTGTVPDLSQLPKLTELRLEDNQLTGVLSAILPKLPTTLDYLRLGSNQFTGAIPDFSQFPELTYLDLGGNPLTGTIPAGLGNLAKLQTLRLNDNQLTGTIPATWGTTTHPFSTTRAGLWSLYLQNNALTGAIPESLGLFENLGTLRLDHNQLTGTIPATWGTTSHPLQYLSELGLSHNQLSGSIPATFRDADFNDRMRFLYLNNNQFTGSIPDFSQFTRLRELHLHLNEDLTGSLVVSSSFTAGEVYIYGTRWRETIPQTLLDAVAAGRNLRLLTNRRPRSPGYIENVTVEPGADFCYVLWPFLDPEGEALTYHVTLLDGRPLPGWLTFDAANRAVSGRSPQQAGDFAFLVQVTDEDSPPTPPTPATPFCDFDRGFDADGNVVGDETHPPALCVAADFRIWVQDDHDSPRNIQLAPDDGTVTVTWEPPTDTGGDTITGYNVRHRRLGRTGWTVVAENLPADSRSYTIMNLATETPYEVQVQAVLGTDISFWSASRKVQWASSGVPPQQPPSPPGRSGGGGGGRPAAEPDPDPDPEPDPEPIGFLENPRPASFRSGVSVLSGWLCEAEVVEMEIDGGPRIEAAYGTDRADTLEFCGDRDNGFGLLFNWNLLGDGDHTIRVLADGVEFGRATFTVTTLGEEFVEDAAGEAVVLNFPTLGETARLVWQEARQNFLLAPLDATPAASPLGPSGGPTGVLENPRPVSFQSGIGVLSGWTCEAEVVELEINGESRLEAAYGTDRADTLESCGDRDNGFGVLFNWNLLGDGDHTVRALADGAEFGRATFTVTTLGEEFVEDAAGEAVAIDFPTPGSTVRLIWQEADQNFVPAAFIPSSASPSGQ